MFSGRTYDYLDTSCLGFGNHEILVVGEAVLDRYVFGETDRISPEAPIPVLKVRGYEERPGNACFVSANLASLGARPSLLSVIGSDEPGRRLRNLLIASGIKTTALVQDPSRPTILKERLMGSVQSAQRATQQLLRVDHEDPRPLTKPTEARVRKRLEESLDSIDGILVCDIGKGVLTPALLRTIIDAAGERRKPVIIDPRRAQDYSMYQGATALTPNRYEAERVTGLDLQTNDSWKVAALRLIDTYDLSACLITLDRDGLMIAEDSGEAVHIPTIPREVYDVTGAGDVVLAVFGLCVIHGFDLLRAAMLANLAAGLEVAKQGAAVISQSELREALGAPEYGSSRKMMPLEQLSVELRRHRRAGRRICFTDDSFSPIQASHIKLLEYARAQGDLLVVGVQRNNDCGASSAADGIARIVAGIGVVDYVILTDAHNIEEVVKSIRPDVFLALQLSYSTSPTAALIESYGGRLLANYPRS
jgi:D-beta-D-heptose 7-phosphate kinase/D-beta-D-heptose 1-phosphate adenosyltransferase